MNFASTTLDKSEETFGQGIRVLISGVESRPILCLLQPQLPRKEKSVFRYAIRESTGPSFIVLPMFHRSNMPSLRSQNDRIMVKAVCPMAQSILGNTLAIVLLGEETDHRAFVRQPKFVDASHHEHHIPPITPSHPTGRRYLRSGRGYESPAPPRPSAIQRLRTSSITGEGGQC